MAVRVYYEDTDFTGIVYRASYLCDHVGALAARRASARSYGRDVPRHSRDRVTPFVLDCGDAGHVLSFPPLQAGWVGWRQV